MEDDPGQARLLQRTLLRNGYAVDVANNGTQGQSMFDAGTYEVLLTDHDMPGMSGLELIRALASRGRLPLTIMVTGAGNEAVDVEAMKLGAHDYIIKDSCARYLELIPTVVDQALAKLFHSLL
ncbi:response regulator [Thermodesulfobacteriota bacterium]